MTCALNKALLGVTLALALTGAAPAAAQAVFQEAGASRTLAVAKDKSAAFRLARPAGEIVVAQPDMIQIVAQTDRSFYIRGKALGQTTILVYDRNKRLSEVFDVRVGYDTEAIRADIAQALPGEKIQVRNVATGVMLTGDVSTSSIANRAKVIAERYAPEAVTNALNVAVADQVILEVRVVEAGRTVMNDLGFGLQAANNSGFVFAAGNGLIGASPPAGVLGISTNIGTTRIDLSLEALEEKGLVRTLARPNLVAMSGQEASFLAGGEFPFPIPVDENTVAIEFKPFGVKLDFTPVVQDNGLIRLKVAPEVSQLDPRQSLRVSGIDIPSLSVRRAATTVELRDGESFAIAGLFQQDYANSLRQVPGVGNIPVLGALFRSSQFRKNETELVIIVTPRTSAALPGRTPPTDPLMASAEPSAIDLILMGVNEKPPAAAPAKPRKKRRS
ncbi:MAG: type II and III secretion system protein family protein [Caulobacteraceae bacterium]|nr:type II and III secretion system protein family protein [Caulobacteraceae bacterium]